MAANIIITLSPPAASGVSIGAMCKYHGNIKPALAVISEIPINRTKCIGRSTTPVCLVSINFCLEKVDFAKPISKNVIASSICAIHNAMFMLYFSAKLSTPQQLSFDIYQKIKLWLLSGSVFPVLSPGKTRSCPKALY